MIQNHSDRKQKWWWPGSGQGKANGKLMLNGQRVSVSTEFQWEDEKAVDGGNEGCTTM